MSDDCVIVNGVEFVSFVEAAKRIGEHPLYVYDCVKYNGIDHLVIDGRIFLDSRKLTSLFSG